MTSVAVITIEAAFSEDYRMEERPVPVPGPGEVLVKVEAVGICAGDSKCFAGAARFWGERRATTQHIYAESWEFARGWVW